MAHLIEGNIFRDKRGLLKYNNEFDLSEIKRLYIIQNDNKNIIRGWQGHKIEQRWFTSILGIFKINLIQIDNWEKPSQSLIYKSYILDSKKLCVLHVPPGFVSSIQSLTIPSKLLVFADYRLNEINDNYRYDINYFKSLDLQ